jgi:hypothetical protein
MAHIEVWYHCPVCQRPYDKQSDAIACRNSHPINTEKWAVGKGGKAVRIFDHCALDGLGGRMVRASSCSHCIECGWSKCG